MENNKKETALEEQSKTDAQIVFELIIDGLKKMNKW